MAQPQSDEPPGAPGGSLRGDPINAARLGLAPEAVAIESLGLEIHAPAGALVRKERVEDRITVSFIDGAEPPIWSMRVQPLVAVEPVPNPKARIDEMIRAWDSQGLRYRLLRNEQVTFDGRPGHIMYAAHEIPGTDPSVSGWLILPNGTSESVVFAIQIASASFERLAPVFEACFGSMLLRSPDAVARVREARLESGKSMLETLDPATLRGLVGRRTWHRYYMPAGVGGSNVDTELGYFTVAFAEAKLGAINPKKDPARYTPSDDEVGFLVSVDAHYLGRGAATTYDSQARYWVAWDQSHEAWSIRGTQRFRRKTNSNAQTGLRSEKSTNDPTGRIMVIVHAQNGTSRNQRSWGTPDVYLSQALRWALGGALPRTDEVPITFSTYCVDMSGRTPALSLRIDRWEPVTRPSGDWILVTQPRAEGQTMESVYAPDGTLKNRTWPDGSVSRAISLESLHRLWRRKGLETGRFDR